MKNRSERVPDAKALWLFREQLARHGLVEESFDAFDERLRRAGHLPRGGQIIDAGLVNVPGNRNRRKENEQIKQGKVPEAWEARPDKKRQKDLDARWTEKHGKSHYGYKNPIDIDKKNKRIRRYAVTGAAVHGSRVFDELLDEENRGRSIWADAAYRSREREAALREAGCRSRIHHKGGRNRKLSQREQQSNRARSRIRARVEHVFGRRHMLNGGGFWVRVEGKVRAAAKIGLMNRVYHMRRLDYLPRGSSARMAG